MKKFLMSLVLVTPLVCEPVDGNILSVLSRCENDEVVCYLYSGRAMQCQFKGAIDE